MKPGHVVFTILALVVSWYAIAVTNQAPYFIHPEDPAVRQVSKPFSFDQLSEVPIPVMSGATELKVGPAKYGNEVGRLTKYSVDASRDEVVQYYRENLGQQSWWFYDGDKPGDIPIEQRYKSYMADQLGIPSGDLPYIFTGSNGKAALVRVSGQILGNTVVEVFVFHFSVSIDVWP